MKCGGCKWQSVGMDDSGNEINYCIGSPQDEPKYGSELKIDSKRIVSLSSGEIYRADDLDECHVWHSERFEQPKEVK